MNRTTLSQLKTTLYRKPRDEWRRFSRWGPRAYFQCDRWAEEMEASVIDLPLPECSDESAPLEVWFLTGKRFWYQTAYCAWSLAKQSRREVVLNLIDDGTLDEVCLYQLRQLFPKGACLTSEGTEEEFNESLPRDLYPVLRQRCDDYINIRKLVDVHLSSYGWKLVLDSDMLFFSDPIELTQWWDGTRTDSGNHPLLLMKDCEESYGYSRELMESLTGEEIPPLLNVGVCGIRSETIDWEEIEHWCATLSEKEGTSYFLEQALVAMMASSQPHTVLPSDTYVTFPREEDARQGAGTLQHYVADSKPWYFGEAWKVARDSEAALFAVELPS
ncbi:MAG: glycosyl transferase [Verrucomicrobiota bacterium]